MNKIIIKKKINFKSIYVVFFFFLFLLIAKNIWAASITLETGNKKLSVGDIITANVVLDTEGQTINVVEGTISVSTGLDIIAIKELSLADSVLSSWVRNPSWSEKDGTISFVGGTPGGFNQAKANLFKIFFTTKAGGTVTFSPLQIKAYSNDGLATPVEVKFQPATVFVDQTENLIIKDEWREVISQDTKAPIDIIINLGQDASLFEGKKFIVVTATDPDSGINYFEVKEGDRNLIKTSSIYVLQNQANLERIVILAYDKAGNVSRKELVVKASFNNYLPKFVYFIIFFSAIIMLLVWFKKIRNKK